MDTLWGKVGLLFAGHLALMEVGLALVVAALWVTGRGPRAVFQVSRREDGSITFNTSDRAQTGLAVALSMAFAVCYLLFYIRFEGLEVWAGLGAAMLAGPALWAWLEDRMGFPWELRHALRCLVIEAVVLSLAWEAIFSEGEGVWRIAALVVAVAGGFAFVWTWRKAAAEAYADEPIALMLLAVPVLFAGGAFAISLREPEQATDWGHALEVLGILFRELLSLVGFLLETLL